MEESAPGAFSPSCLLPIERGRRRFANGVFQTGLMALIKWKHLLGRCTESLSSLILQHQMASSCCLFRIKLPAHGGAPDIERFYTHRTCASGRPTKRQRERARTLAARLGRNLTEKRKSICQSSSGCLAKCCSPGGRSRSAEHLVRVSVSFRTRRHF